MTSTEYPRSTPSMQPPSYPYPTPYLSNTCMVTSTSKASSSTSASTAYASRPQSGPSLSWANSKPSTTAASSSASSSTTGLTRPSPSNDKIEQIAAKSCLKCRDRKVKCDRIYPTCGRCTKREDDCSYKAGMIISTRCLDQNEPAVEYESEEEELSSPPLMDPSKTLPRTNLVETRHILSSPTSTLPQPQQATLYSDGGAIGSHHHEAYSTDPARPLAVLPNRYSGSASHEMQHSTIYYERDALSRPPPNAYNSSSATSNHNSISNQRGLRAPSSASSWISGMEENNIGERSVDWQLARPTMAISLQRHLLDASMDSCCSHLPAFRPFASRIPYFQQHMEDLNLADQVIVSVLVSLGARASPHSALLGIAGLDIEGGRTPLSLILSAGQRREKAWRAIADRAVELCSLPEVIQVPSKENVESLVACSSMLKLCETRPTRARFFLRNVIGMFEDLQASAGMSSTDVQNLKNSVGPTVYESDARVAAYLSMPVIISEADVDHYFDGSTIVMPDLSQDSLMDDLNAILDAAQGSPGRGQIDKALGLAAYYVCSIQRRYAGMSSTKRSSNSFMKEVPKLWTYIDSAHGAVQHLHRTLVGLNFSEDEYSDHAVEYDLLIAVRMDTRLIDVINLNHAFLCRQLQKTWSDRDRSALEQLVALSERRVRKALKLLSFYAKVFYDSRDKHLVYHLYLQLDVLPGWLDMIPQRVGELTAFGPLNQESALTEQELDWMTKGLELAAFYMPSAVTQLEKLKRSRDQRRSDVGIHSYSYDLAPTDFQSPAISTGSSSSTVDSINSSGREQITSGSTIYELDTQATSVLENAPPLVNYVVSSSGVVVPLAQETVVPGQEPMYLANVNQGSSYAQMDPSLQYQSFGPSLGYTQQLNGSVEPAWIPNEQYESVMSAGNGVVPQNPSDTSIAYSKHPSTVGNQIVDQNQSQTQYNWSTAQANAYTPMNPNMTSSNVADETNRSRWPAEAQSQWS